jgi:hypothetical protein
VIWLSAWPARSAFTVGSSRELRRVDGLIASAGAGVSSIEARRVGGKKDHSRNVGMLWNCAMGLQHLVVVIVGLDVALKRPFPLLVGESEMACFGELGRDVKSDHYY